jgi:DNA-binding MarR family transcriptional regulator
MHDPTGRPDASNLPSPGPTAEEVRRRTADDRRHNMRIRARRRQQRDRCNYTTALFRVRRSEILVFLSRNPGRRFNFVELADATAVPVSAVRSIVRHLEKQDHELIQGMADG